MLFLTVFKMQLLGKFFYFCPSIWPIIALFPMVDNECWDLQNLHWKIVKSLFTFSKHELNAGSRSQQSWKNVFFDIIFSRKKDSLLLISTFWGQVTIPKESFSLLSHELIKFPEFSLTFREFSDFPWYSLTNFQIS